MAKVKIESVIEQLDHQIRRALEATLNEHFSDRPFDTKDVFRTFKRQVGKKCNTWENVNDGFVDKD